MDQVQHADAVTKLVKELCRTAPGVLSFGTAPVHPLEPQPKPSPQGFVSWIRITTPTAHDRGSVVSTEAAWLDWKANTAARIADSLDCYAYSVQHGIRIELMLSTGHGDWGRLHREFIHILKPMLEAICVEMALLSAG